MLTAISSESTTKYNTLDDSGMLRVISNKEDRDDFVCPVCGQEVIFVRRGSDGTIPHFRHKVEASHPSISESQEHVEGKKFLKEKFEAKNSNNDVELEKIVNPSFSKKSSKEFFDREYEIADLVVNDKFVFELQLSRIGWSEFKKRTEFYSRNGYSVVWILGSDYISFDKKGRYILSDALYKMKNLFNGNLYFYSHEHDFVFAGRFMNFSAKTRASYLKIKQVNFSKYNPNIKAFDHGFVSVFGLVDHSYNEYKSATGLRDSKYRKLQPGDFK